uniref:Putative secreted protein n=1 Tax=Ixodes ricinus TaxID=34613 RepID=A0A6B0U3U7_IXORI
MSWSLCSGSKLWSLGIACAAVLRTYGDMSFTASLMDSIMMGTMTGTRILDSTRRALARISWFGSFRARWKVEMESRARSCCSSA